VAVPIFENDTYVRDVEFELTDAVIKELEARASYKVTARMSADTLLTGPDPEHRAGSALQERPDGPWARRSS
jgi:hypothetical protein